MTLDFSDYKGWRQKLPTMNTHTQKKQKDKKKKNKAPTHNQTKKPNKTNNKISDFHLSEQNLKKKISKSLGPQTILCDVQTRIQVYLEVLWYEYTSAKDTSTQ